ncbi:putative GPI-anchored cupredoxin [Lachnellula occidentalis]|uniref:Putative GPI-anchored cupredoxin n=1 Tax=Lachnellula occidentalis TaxID=215460 RepID=A0A8H8RH67_9HELO|nr:putative GPI-anchored cupredoxin [Lachnellula occidentalis]
MQFTTLALSAMSVAGALAATAGTTVHVVKVGSSNGSLTFAPNDIKVPAGDMVQFQFAPNNHTVTQSTFAKPCVPISQASNVTGIYSGFMPVKATDTNTPTYTMMVNDTKPIWLYCSQGKHCQAGMTMVINAAATGNSTLAAYNTLAKAATANLAPGGVSGGVSGTNSSSASSSSSGSGTSGSGASSGSSTTSASGSSGSSSAAAAADTKNGTSFATAMRPRSVEAISVGSLVALGLAFLF